MSTALIGVGLVAALLIGLLLIAAGLLSGRPTAQQEIVRADLVEACAFYGVQMVDHDPVIAEVLALFGDGVHRWCRYVIIDGHYVLTFDDAELPLMVTGWDDVAALEASA